MTHSRIRNALGDDLCATQPSRRCFGLFQIVLYLGVLLLVKPLGVCMARVYEGTNAGTNRWRGMR